MNDNVEKFQQSFPYLFKDKGNLKEALRHSSFLNERLGKGLKSNERLEFLGDAVLSIVISHILMEVYPDMNEGDLSKVRAGLVNEKTLSSLAKGIDIGMYLNMGKGEEKTGGRERPSILADTLEALIAAVYLDGGYEESFRFVRNMFSSMLDGVSNCPKLVDYKTLLQEETQSLYKTIPTYRLIKEIGPEHDRLFHIEVIIKDEPWGEGTGRSKKNAQQEAAKVALERIDKERNKEL